MFVRLRTRNGDTHMGHLDWWADGRACITGHIIADVVFIDVTAGRNDAATAPRRTPEVASSLSASSIGGPSTGREAHSGQGELGGPAHRASTPSPHTNEAASPARLTAS